MDDKMRGDCWNLALDCFGYYHTYQWRTIRLKKYTFYSRMLSIFVPLLLFTLIFQWGDYAGLKNTLIVVVGVSSIIQLCLSTYLILYHAEHKLMHYSCLWLRFKTLWSDFENLAKYPESSQKANQLQYQKLKTQYDTILNEDDSSPKEKRKGMRIGLREYQRKCATCHKVPIDLTPTDCNNCGNF